MNIYFVYKPSAMGSSSSTEENREDKTIDSNGQVNNNIVIQEARDTHYQMVISEKLLYATYILISIELFKFIIFSIAAFKRNLKKRYGKRDNV